ncbi:MAG: DUF421 domain-containing protein [Gorillibacterium sp.]|nr:DUF421 domain-containing protein [Gorillibacterium sp.]
MDFFASQESLTTLEWSLRAILSFAFLLLVAKMMGQRSISQLRLLDFIIALTLGNIIAHPLSDQHLGLKGSLITTVVLVMLYVGATWLSLKWSFFKQYLDPPAIVLIKNGQINFDHLSKARISIDFLFSELRKSNVDDIQNVSFAAWEPGGTISVFMNTPYQPVTPKDLNLETQPFNLIRPIIINGKVDKSLLKEIGKDQSWLQAEIAPTYPKVRDVTLATTDENANIRVYSKNPK